MFRFFVAAVVASVLLTACSPAPGQAEQNLSSARPSAVPSTTAAATAVAAQIATKAPQPTQMPPTQVPPPTAVPPTPVPATQTSAPTVSVPAAATNIPAPAAIVVSTTNPTVEPAPAQPASEILFLRKGVLTAFDLAKKTERTIVDGVSDFSVAANGTTIALVRGDGVQANIWVVLRDGSRLVQLTDDDRVDASPSVANDGNALVFASSSANKPYSRSWPDWGQWCATSEVRLFDLITNQLHTLGQGCDPAFGPDGKRIAFATPPAESEGEFTNARLNSVRMVNRQGQNGWNLAKTDGGTNVGLLVYAPAWSPDGSRLVYHRFLGYQALVDLGMSELSVAFRAAGKPVYTGAGWQLPARFSPNGAEVAITEDNYSDARGFGGYDNWSVTVIPLQGTRTEALPQGEVTMVGAQLQTLQRAQSGAWSPDSTQLAVLLPPKWQPELPNDQPINNGESSPGELWLWKPGSRPTQRLATDVDFASPVVWLP